MFNLLKNKLKNWVDKAKETFAQKEPEEKQVKESSEESIKKPGVIHPKKEKPTPKEPKSASIEKAEKIPKEILKERVSTASDTDEIQKPSPKEIKGETVPEPLQTPEEPKKKSFFQKLTSTFTYTLSEEDFNNLFDDLEMNLLENNVAYEAVEKIKNTLAKNLVGKEIKKDHLESEITQGLKNALNELLIEPDDLLETIQLKKERPFVVLLCGINGTGKTTTTAKLAYLFKKNKHSVVLAAGDTFRAASIEQITEHGKNLNIHVIKQEYNSDPAAVGFDAIQYAKKNAIDIVIIDTAGRMHTKTNLLAEMEKIARVTKPDLTLFVAEAIAGNDAVEQAKAFHESIGIDGTILSKADIDEKGGTIISISHATHKPIFYLGTGQTYADLKPFNKQEFIKNLGL